jgi:phage-related protein
LTGYRDNAIIRFEKNAPLPRTEVIIVTESDGSTPLLTWLDNRRQVSAKARDKCIVRVERLAECGYELRRPDADYLRDDIYELRTRLGHVNYRILYFFHERGAVLTHGFTKETEVPDREIEIAISRKKLFEQNPDRHTYPE